MINSLLGARKPLEIKSAAASGQALHRTLSWPHLVALGVGAIVGTGIYTLTGVGAERAGPAVIVAFAIAGMVCACAALCYVEMATLIPSAGSAYTYSYTAVGKNVAWIVGWSLILEYSLAVGGVSVGWSGYLVGWIRALGVDLPLSLTAGPSEGGYINLPAVLVVLTIAGMLIAGTRESAWFNAVLVSIKLLALGAFVALALPAFDRSHLTPFMPYGFVSHVDPVTGTTKGVMAAAAIVFFAFYGFDAVATSAEEAKDPVRDVKIGIMGSMLLCTGIYMAVALAAIGAVDFRELAASSESLAYVLRTLGHPMVASLVGLAAIVALPSVVLVMMYGQTRVFFAMSRDGLLPATLSKVSARTGTPLVATIITALFVSLVAGVLPLAEIAELANAGTLLAFIAVAISMLVLRRSAPDAPRLFRCPAPLLTGSLAVLGCCYLLASLPAVTLSRFVTWNILGLFVFMALMLMQRRSIRQIEEARSRVGDPDAL